MFERVMNTVASVTESFMCGFVVGFCSKPGGRRWAMERMGLTSEQLDDLLKDLESSY